MTEKKIQNFHGSITALVTPFKDGKVDERAFAGLVERQIEAGTDGLVPMGTTGESPTVSTEEHNRVVALCVEVARNRVPVIAGAGSNSTAEALHHAQEAQAAGADGLLMVTGYYNKPSQEGIYQHFKSIVETVELPIIVYNIPGRAVVDISVETMARLAALPGVLGVKDATGDLARVALQRVACGPDFVQLSGEDMTAVGYNAMGGVGCISVTANVAPALCSAMQEACREGAWDTALGLQDKLAPLHKVLFCEPSPAPVKYALSRLGLCEEELRAPMLPATVSAREKIDRVLSDLGLL